MKEFILVRCGKHQLTFPTLESWNRYYDEFKDQFGDVDCKLYHVQLTEIENNKNS